MGDGKSILGEKGRMSPVEGDRSDVRQANDEVNTTLDIVFRLDEDGSLF